MILRWPAEGEYRDNLIRHLQRDGYVVDELGRIRGGSAAALAEIPLDHLRDASSIYEHLERIATTATATQVSRSPAPRRRLAKVQTQFLLGEYELAAFAAMREVEIRVRELAHADNSLIGVKLMREAFKPDGGPLADENLDAGERVGMMELFAGAIGTFKNPPSHRQVDYDDPTEASEVVMLADLLMRILDRL